MGRVYRARYVVNGREVALKMVPADVTDQTALARFERELDVLKNLKHPNIVRCFGGSCENKRRFYAMELVSGGTLEDQLQEKKRLPWEQVIYYGLQMCDALACSHEKGVVHRDVKPSNFLITKSGQLKLSDFGLASVATSRRITAAGKTAGTFLYMAPEQIRGQEVTPQTDLYAMGCVLYELVTGVPPFIGDTPAATLHMHCRDTPVRPTEKAMDCPVALERIILQLMEKDAKDRPQSATQVASLLKGVKQTVTIVSPTTESRLDRLSSIVPVTPAESPFLKPDLPEPTQQNQLLPKWAFITLVTALLVSLIGNISTLTRSRSNHVSEELWVQALENHQIAVQLAATNALGEIARETGRHVDLIERGLDNEDSQVRLASVAAVLRAGPYGKPLVPNLIGLTKTDANTSVREAARQAVEKLQKTKSPSRFPWVGTILTTLLMSIFGAGVYLWKKSV